MQKAQFRPAISVIILNYNGARWIEACLNSVRKQTIFSEIEVIVADNASVDGSDKVAARLVSDWANGLFIDHGKNLGYCEGNNRAAAHARGRYLFFLNNDTWLEENCLEELLRGVQRNHFAAASPLVLNYDDNSTQVVFGLGFDIFGLPVLGERSEDSCEIFMPPGCSYIVESELFRELGEFDREIYLYSDELDLSWRIWLNGRTCGAVQTARLHHRWAANVNPKGDAKIVEFRTSDAKRFYANRNSLLVILKNAKNMLLALAPLQIMLLALESVFGAMLLRRWSFFKRTFLDALAGCWRLRYHICAERRRIRQFRKRSDWRMLRFLKGRFNRWDEVRRVRQLGLPKVTAS